MKRKTKAWTDEEVDELLEWFLIHRRSYSAIKVQLGRSFDSIDVKLRKLAMGYSSTDQNYEPRKRTKRAGLPWSLRDVYLYKIWRDNEQYGGLEHLSKLLARPIEDIQRHTIPNFNRKGFDL